MIVEQQEGLINIKEAARRLGVSEKTIRRMIHAKPPKIRAIAVNWSYRFDPAEVERIRTGKTIEGQEGNENEPIQ